MICTSSGPANLEHSFQCSAEVGFEENWLLAEPCLVVAFRNRNVWCIVDDNEGLSPPSTSKIDDRRLFSILDLKTPISAIDAKHQMMSAHADTPLATCTI